MWLLEAFLALSLIPAAIGVPLYLGFVLGTQLAARDRPVAISAAIALGIWALLSLQLLLLPLIRCRHGCPDGSLGASLATYILAAAVLGTAVWWFQRSRSATPTTRGAAAGR